MHELSIAQAVIEQVDALARQHGARSVALIRLQVGPLSGVVPELLHTALPLAAAGSLAEAARLEISQPPVRVRCETCGAETEAAPNHLLCDQCGDWHTQVVSGEELILERVEMDIPETASPLTPNILKSADDADERR